MPEHIKQKFVHELQAEFLFNREKSALMYLANQNAKGQEIHMGKGLLQ